jgi:hypothetical protein
VPPSELRRAVALNALPVNIGRAIGPAMGGVLFAAAGPALVFAFNPPSFVAGLAVVYQWRASWRTLRPRIPDGTCAVAWWRYIHGIAAVMFTSSLFLVDQVRNLGRCAGAVKCPGHLLSLTVSPRHPLVLAEMLHPGCHQKRFDIALWMGGIIEQFPPHRAVSEPFPLQLTHGGGEIMGSLGLNKVFDQHEHRSVLRVRLHDDVRLRPMQRWGEIERFPSRQPIAGDTASPAINPIAAHTSAAGMPTRAARVPHRRLPTAVPPWNTRR